MSDISPERKRNNDTDKIQIGTPIELGRASVVELVGVTHGFDFFAKHKLELESIVNDSNYVFLEENYEDIMGAPQDTKDDYNGFYKNVINLAHQAKKNILFADPSSTTQVPIDIAETIYPLGLIAAILALDKKGVDTISVSRRAFLQKALTIPLLTWPYIFSGTYAGEILANKINPDFQLANPFSLMEYRNLTIYRGIVRAEQEDLINGYGSLIIGSGHLPGLSQFAKGTAPDLAQVDIFSGVVNPQLSMYRPTNLTYELASRISLTP